MKFTKEGDWIVSTPIYIVADVQKAMACAHKTYEPGAKAVEHGHLIIQETCQNCRASRVRYRVATPEETKELGGRK